MKDVVKSSFSLEGHKIKRFLLQEPADRTKELSIRFEPAGKLLQKENKYILTFGFFAISEDEKDNFIEAIVEGDFIFDKATQLQDIPDYFYANSIAILFPYLRAFVTTLTSVANIKPLILPTLNLTRLEGVLIENTQVA